MMDRCQVIKQMIGCLEGSCEFTDLKSPLILSVIGFISTLYLCLLVGFGQIDTKKVCLESRKIN